ncbi:MAG: bifunctional 2-C-methyl-D-erythritol 4-phosphate cytidylyltransferase/2-C-methyl-D-erythritol 2,4-cyclodiphosphate synthase, partial [bacterium]|nr:bifunctional 2-C-methyl-D-erythritol 4-phosphate cytidylyltransferase/2-C-methyl-D-erythritol 2,4-cyclodiphosphate synthase [bacterium]
PDIIRRAYGEAKSAGFVGTDSSSLVERLGLSVAVVDGTYENIKITTAEDLIIAEEILRARNKG